MKNSVLIIGSGWLGMPLAKHLATKSYDVIATTTTNNKLENTTKELPIILLDATDKTTTMQQICDLSPQTIIITIAPSRDLPSYQHALMNLAACAQQAKVKRVVFISSSSVWGDLTGNITELTPPSPTSNSAKIMVDFEQYLVTLPTIESCTLHLAGLFNSQRHPGRFLSGKTDVANPDAAVNMIHQQDCIGLIEAILAAKQWQSSYIGCAPSHPTRSDFYCHCANSLGVTAPVFVDNGGAQLKSIDGQATARSVGYQYIFDNLYPSHLKMHFQETWVY